MASATMRMPALTAESAKSTYARKQSGQTSKKPLAGAFCIVLWGERRGSNPRQPESQSGTLPTELRPPLKT